MLVGLTLWQPSRNVEGDAKRVNDVQIRLLSLWNADRDHFLARPAHQESAIPYPRSIFAKRAYTKPAGQAQHYTEGLDT
jgi:hypothetical protein